jgi:glycosyltransferase involved in cell wall biosynthesis
LIALYLPYLSPTVDYRPHLEALGPATLLDWAATRFSAALPTVIAFHPGPDRDYLASVRDGSYRSVPCQAPSKLAALAAAIESTDAPAVLCCNLEAAFLPSCALEAAFEAHIRASTAFTVLSGLPKGVHAEVYSRELLTDLAGLRLPDKPTDPVELIRRLSLDAMLFPGRWPPIASATHPVNLPGAPRDISIQDAFDVEVARQAIRSCADGDLLASWNRAARDSASTPLPAWTPLARPERPRVLFLSNHSGYSGAEEALVETVRALPPGRFDLTAFVSLPGRFSNRLAQAGCRLYGLPTDISRATARNVGLLVKLLQALRPDVVHLNSYSGMPILAAAASLEIPIVQHARVLDLDSLEEALRHAAMVAAVSVRVRRSLHAMPVPAERIRVLYDGVDPHRFDPAAVDRTSARRALGLPESATVVLLPARVERKKRHDLFVEALAMLTAPGRDVIGLIVGDDSGDPAWSAALDELILRKGLASRILRLGFQHEMPPLYAAADAIVSCSGDEALGCAVLEAMSMARPVVVTDTGGACELVADGFSGLVIAAGDANALAGALARLEDPETRRELGENARRRVLERYSTRHCATQFADILEEALAVRE